MPDSQVIANAIRQAELEKRQAELEKRHRDLTKPMPPIGTDGESLRAQKGFEGITDEILAERATFNLKDHMKGARNVPITLDNLSVNGVRLDTIGTIGLSEMSMNELDALANATLTEMARRQPKEQG